MTPATADKPRGAAKRALKCKICLAPARIREMVNEQLMQGVSLRDIGDKVGCDKSSVHRHKTNCLPAEIRAIPTAIEAIEGELVDVAPQGAAIAVQAPGEACPIRTTDNFRDWTWNEVVLRLRDAADRAKAAGQTRIEV